MLVKSTYRPAVLLAAAAILTTGCATKKYVQTEMQVVESRVAERVDGIETQVEENQSAIQENEERLAAASETAREAYDRAVAAGALAEGKFLYETVLSSDRFRFAVDRSDLSSEAQAALDEFAVETKGKNENVFIEIQGHTDSTGSEEYNLSLGEKRAEAVRRYLSDTHGFALHRMAVISYGESAPIADNGNREGRSQNRRVSLVVLK